MSGLRAALSSPKPWRPPGPRSRRPVIDGSSPTACRNREELDPNDATAVDLAAAYAQRWEIETAFDELKTHQRGPKIVLRSKLADLVRQEIWGYLCCHYAIRTMMFEAAEHAKVDTDRVSFVAALRFARRSISQARDFSP